MGVEVDHYWVIHAVVLICQKPILHLFSNRALWMKKRNWDALGRLLDHCRMLVLGLWRSLKAFLNFLLKPLLLYCVCLWIVSRVYMSRWLKKCVIKGQKLRLHVCTFIQQSEAVNFPEKLVKIKKLKRKTYVSTRCVPPIDSALLFLKKTRKLVWTYETKPLFLLNRR